MAARKSGTKLRPALLTEGAPPVAGPGVNPHLLGTVPEEGHPLDLLVKDAGTPGSADGHGVSAFGGTFQLVALA